MASLIRTLLPSDLAFGLELSGLAGWNQTRRDWERFLSLAPEECFLAEVDGQTAGTATTTSYESDLAWIGMVLVHPDFRRQGMGTALLERAIRHLREERRVTCVRLDATPDGKPLYEGLGFRSEWGLRRWVKEVHETSSRFSSTPEWTFSSASLELDRAVFGASRFELLQSLLTGSSGGITLEDGSFGLIRPGKRASYLGPVTAASRQSAEVVIRELLESCPPGNTVFWDIPDPNEAATGLAERLGFQPVRVLTRMWLGDRAIEQDPERIVALAEPGLG